ncbi:MAG TPA: NAD(P)H-binding protein [Solirubrobacteraceae bacterium]|nr:NAD(P)H-binding protein [Solirubrobacteraceae bacterium]
MARVLIIGCGCRGQQLARELAGAGHAVRGTTRDPARFEAIAAAGAEPVRADPDRVGTLVAALAGVTVVVRLLAGVEDPELHGPRLRALLEKLVDTPVRAYVHERVGEADEALVREAAATWSIPVAVVASEPWPLAAMAPLTALLDSPQAQKP